MLGHTWGEHTILTGGTWWHATEAVLTRSAMVYGCFPCNAAWMSHTWVAESSVAGRRSMDRRVVKHYSMFTVIYRVCQGEALVRHVGRVRDRS